MQKQTKIIGATIFILAIFVFLYFFRVSIKDFWDLQQRKITLPQELPAQGLNKKTPEPIVVSPFTNSEPEIKKDVAPTLLPAEINLAVPFVSQAPFKNWDETHEETCEEASALMINGFFKGEKYTRQQMEDELQKIIAWENTNLGFFKDTTVEETARFMREIYGLNAVVKYDITVEDLKQVLTNGQPIIIPAAGKLLPNPYFSNGGPVYHMLVLKGYTKDNKFISNDPGTNILGENFTYEFDALYIAIHDWVKDGDILIGRKAMIVVE